MNSCSWWIAGVPVVSASFTIRHGCQQQVTSETWGCSVSVQTNLLSPPRLISVRQEKPRVTLRRSPALLSRNLIIPRWRAGHRRLRIFKLGRGCRAWTSLWWHSEAIRGSKGIWFLSGVSEWNRPLCQITGGWPSRPARSAWRAWNAEWPEGDAVPESRAETRAYLDGRRKKVASNAQKSKHPRVRVDITAAIHASVLLSGSAAVKWLSGWVVHFLNPTKQITTGDNSKVASSCCRKGENWN